MKLIVVGLGNFGGNLSVRLAELGHEVVGVDHNPDMVDRIKSKLSMAIVMNAVSVEAVSTLPLAQVDMIVVAIGGDFAASTQAVAALRQCGVTRIVARGLSDLHVGVLQTLGVEKVVFPERDSAELLAQSLSLSGFVSSFVVDKDHYVMQFMLPDELIGFTIDQSQMESKFGLKVLAVKRQVQLKNMLGLSHTERMVVDGLLTDIKFMKSDIVVIYGKLSSYDEFSKSLRGLSNKV